MPAGASVASIEAGRAVVRFIADDSMLQKSLQSMAVELKTWGSRISNMGRSMMVAGAAGASLFIKPIMEASRTEQLMGRFAAVFDEAASSAGKFADTLAKDINKSGLEIRDMMAQFQVMLKGVGFGSGQATQMSQQLTQLTNDWIAFDDTITNGQEALDLFRSAMAGETEPARRMGADLRVVTMNSEFMAKGIKNASLSLSEMERMQWRIGKISEALTRSGVTGQAAREVNMAASLMRGFKAMVRDLFSAIGSQLLPVFSEWAKSLTAVGRELQAIVQSGGSIIPMLAEMTVKVALAGAAFWTLGKAITAAAAATTTLKALAGLKFLVSTPILGIPTALVAGLGTLLIAMNASADGAEKTWGAFSKLFGAMGTAAKDTALTLAMGDLGLAFEIVSASASRMWAQFKLDMPTIYGYIKFIEDLTTAISNLYKAMGSQSRLNKALEGIADANQKNKEWIPGDDVTALKNTIAISEMRVSLALAMRQMELRMREIDKQLGLAGDVSKWATGAWQKDAAAWAKPEGSFERNPFGSIDSIIAGSRATPAAAKALVTRIIPDFLSSQFNAPYLSNRLKRKVNSLWDDVQRYMFASEEVGARERARRALESSRYRGGIVGQLENMFWRLGMTKEQSIWGLPRGANASERIANQLQYGQSLDVEKQQLITQKNIETLLFEIGKKDGALIAGLF